MKIAIKFSVAVSGIGFRKLIQVSLFKIRNRFSDVNIGKTKHINFNQKLLSFFWILFSFSKPIKIKLMGFLVIVVVSQKRDTFTDGRTWEKTKNKNNLPPQKKTHTIAHIWKGLIHFHSSLYLTLIWLVSAQNSADYPILPNIGIE